MIVRLFLGVFSLGPRALVFPYHTPPLCIASSSLGLLPDLCPYWSGLVGFPILLLFISSFPSEFMLYLFFFSDLPLYYISI